MPETRAIREFLAEQYTDEKLAALLAHAEDNKLSFHSCCCLIGVATADHALQPRMSNSDLNVIDRNNHLLEARAMPGSIWAETEFYRMGEPDLYSPEEADQRRRERLIPLIIDEMARRVRAEELVTA